MRRLQLTIVPFLRPNHVDSAVWATLGIILEITLSSVLLLGITGFFAGGINTVAGGGSNLALPALMVLGLPADIANAPNRVAVTMQGLVGLAGYDKHETLVRPAVIPSLIPTVLGGVGGSMSAPRLHNLLLTQNLEGPSW